jgi:hypothetical protein
MCVFVCIMQPKLTTISLSRDSDGEFCSKALAINRNFLRTGISTVGHLNLLVTVGKMIGAIGEHTPACYVFQLIMELHPHLQLFVLVAVHIVDQLQDLLVHRQGEFKI